MKKEHGVVWKAMFDTGCCLRKQVSAYLFSKAYG